MCVTTSILPTVAKVFSAEQVGAQPSPGIGSWHATYVAGLRSATLRRTRAVHGPSSPQAIFGPRLSGGWRG